MRAHRSVIALVAMTLWSLVPLGSARAKSAYASNAEPDLQGASDQIPAAWRNLPKVQIAVDGASNPERIPDNLAFRHFIRATASSASAADIRRRELLLTTAGLSVADRLAFVNALGDIPSRLRSTRQKPSPANATRSTAALDEQAFDEVQRRIQGALSPAGAAALRTHIQAYLKRRIVIYATPSAGTAAPCRWDQVSLFVEEEYSEVEGAWTAYSQADFGPEDCCDREYRIELVASTQVSTYRTVADSTAAEITRVYDEPGPLDYHAGLWIECPGTNGAMAFGNGPATGGTSRPRTVTVGSGTGIATQDPQSTSELSIPLASGTGQSAAGRMLVTLETSSDVVLRQPIVIRLTIENRSTETLEFDLGKYDKNNVQFQITRPDGVVTNMLRCCRDSAGGLFMSGRFVVAPLAVFTRQFLLDEWTTLDLPGQYGIRLAVDSTFRSSSGEVLKGPVDRTLSVRVGSFDFERLGRVCERLAQVAIEGTTAEARRDAATALAHVADPVALPAIRRVLQAATRFDSDIARGLMRMGTGSARSVLEDMAASSQPERSAIARDTLSRLNAR